MDNKCVICGMLIKSKSYNLNNSTFIEKNSEIELKNCPFCGVSRVYIDKDKEVYKSEVELDKESLKILDKAVKLEIFNGEFYKEASILAQREDIKKLFKELSNIEFMHAKIHSKLGSFKELPKLHKPNYQKHDTDKKLLKEAKNREKHAIEFYNKNIENISSKVVKEVFRALIEVEKQHKNIADIY